MKEAHKTKDRRQFIKDGLRTVLLSGLAFTGLSLGWRGGYRSGNETSCPIDLPCRICSQLPGCGRPEAVDAKQEAREFRYRLSSQKRGTK